MAWKKDENNNFVADENGNPIFIHDSGDEKGLDAKYQFTERSRLSSENSSLKSQVKDYESEMQKIKEEAGEKTVLEYLELSKKNAQLVASMADKDKDVEERIQAQVKAGLEAKDKELSGWKERAVTAETNLAQEKIQSEFHNSKWGKENFIDTTMAFDLLNKNLEYKDGKVIAKDKNGTVIFGENGEASLDEALPRLLDESPYKKHLLKGSSATGSGATLSNGTMGNNFKNPFSKEHRNVTEQNRIALENPSYAKELAKQAGISI